MLMAASCYCIGGIHCFRLWLGQPTEYQPMKYHLLFNKFGIPLIWLAGWLIMVFHQSLGMPHMDYHLAAMIC